VHVSLPITLLLGLVVFFMVRKSELKASHALIAILFGFYLSATAVAARIGQLDTMIAGLLGGTLGPR
jgi:hypothetical protein